MLVFGAQEHPVLNGFYELSAVQPTVDGRPHYQLNATDGAVYSVYWSDRFGDWSIGPGLDIAGVLAYAKEDVGHPADLTIVFSELVGDSFVENSDLSVEAIALAANPCQEGAACDVVS